MQKYKMRCILMLILLCCTLNRVGSRPADPSFQDSELEEADYDRDDEASEDDRHDDEDAPLEEKVSKEVNHEEADSAQALSNRNEYLTQNGRTPSGHTIRRNTYDNFAEYKSGRRVKERDDDSAIEEPEQPYLKRRQSGRFGTNNYGNDQIIQNPEIPSSGFEDSPLEGVALRNDAVNRRKNGARLEDDGDLLFESGDNKRGQVTNVMKNEPNDFNSEPNAQSHIYKKYYNPLRTENIEFEDSENEENHDESNRDRREVQTQTAEEPAPAESKESKDLHNIANEDDQAAIKRHIKKLSSEELEELLNSLSDEKKALLQKIIDNDASNEGSNLNKREITKKAGAVEENNYLDGGSLDTNKIAGPSINMNTDASASQNTETTENTNSTVCPGDIGDTSSTKTADSSISNLVSKESTNNIAGDQDSVQDNSDAANAESATPKNENKREVNINDFNNDESLDNHLNPDESQDTLNEYVCSRDEDLSQLMDDEEQPHYDSRNTHKRDTEQENDARLSKSLQESFPNSNAYDDAESYVGSDMAPLIRVKRRNREHAVKKRAAAILPIESKVAYVPYRAENEDEDNDEGNEFYDDGFFDRTANFAKNVNKLSNSRPKALRLNAEGSPSEAEQSNLVDSLNSDTMGIGTDTDNVLSGVEGVDDNLMFNGGAREKRAAEKGLKLEPADDLIKEDLLTCSQRTTTAVDSSKKTESFTNGVNYDGNEAFGPIPKSYDGELSRYKRIRRLKQSINPGELSTTKATIE